MSSSFQTFTDNMFDSSTSEEEEGSSSEEEDHSSQIPNGRNNKRKRSNKAIDYREISQEEIVYEPCSLPSDIQKESEFIYEESLQNTTFYPPPLYDPADVHFKII